MIEKLKTFLREAKVELKKVTWPDRKVTTASTVVVLAGGFIVGVYPGLGGGGLNQLFHLLLS